MRASSFFFALFRFFLTPSIILTLLLYFYPVLYNCNFPLPRKPQTQCFRDGRGNTSQDAFARVPPAPFRLLTLADPQLEGDSSLPDPNDPLFPSLSPLASLFQQRDPSSIFDTIRVAGSGFVLDDIPKQLQAVRKRIDLWGNDLYLAHVYKLVHWWTKPTHVTVLGDLIGSQWVSDQEFDRRASRFWNIVFKNASKVEDYVSDTCPYLVHNSNPSKYALPWEDSSLYLLEDNSDWRTRIINVAGNHDIGYAGDITKERLSRFEDKFGRANYVLEFVLEQKSLKENPLLAFGGAPKPPSLRLVILNSMNLDSPVVESTLQQDTYDFINACVGASACPVEDRSQATVLLTHIPLHKKEGVCVDAPFFDYSDSGIREQNHLSPDASRSILEAVFGMSNNPEAPANGLGRSGIILNGHDHEGCDTYHWLPQEKTEAQEEQQQEDGWLVESLRWDFASIRKLVKRDVPGIREITVRSMMGSYGGNAGLLSGWFDEEAGEWKFEYNACELGVQHIWWFVHIFDLIILSFLAASAVAYWYEYRTDQRQQRVDQGKQYRKYTQGRDVLVKESGEMFDKSPFDLF